MTSDDEASSGNGRARVSWRDFLAIQTVILGLWYGALWWSFDIHNNQPHAGAVRRDEHSDNVQLLRADINRIATRMDTFSHKLEILNQSVIELKNGTQK